MDKNDFDIDYDFKKELGFDPDEFLNDDSAADPDMSELQDIDLSDMDPADLDLSKYGITEDYDISDDPMPEGEFSDYDLDSPVQPQDGQAYDAGDVELLRRKKEEHEDYVPEDFPMDGEDWAQSENPDEGYDPEAYPQDGEEPAYDDQDLDDLSYDTMPADETLYEDPRQEEQPQEEQPEKKKLFGRKDKKEKKEKPPKEVKIKRSNGPSIFQKFFMLYFGAAIAELSGMNEDQGRRRRSKYRIFKEAYLPPIILIATVLMVLTCIIGSASTLVQRKLVHDENNRKESIAASEEEDRMEQEYVQLMDEADLAAQAYDYDKASEILDT